jgi:hypothetical protein
MPIPFGLQIPDQLRQKIDRELEPRETIKWVGQPIPRYFTAASITTFFFAIPWTAFAIFWMWGASGFGQLLTLGFGLHLLFPLFGLPFVLIGFVMLLSPIWIKQAALQTVYLITDQRAIVIEGGFKTTVRSYRPEQLQEVYRQENKDGTGDVIINVRHWKDSDGDRRSEALGFMGIRNPKEAERMLKALAGISA